ncbi:MAG: hypothetical protein Q7S65_01335 [Nanoarchaeota archaeon]|nr:hypothetical protein [Nanoarchaeota archaeon]
MIPWIELQAVLKPLALFVIGMSAYCVFIFRFYRFIARKDIFKIDLARHNGAKRPKLRKFFEAVFYVLKYLLFFPLIAFFWMAVLTVLLAFLSTQHTIETILLISASIVATIRVCAYYNEELSIDVAKMLPLALLAIFAVDITYVQPALTAEKLMQIPGLLNLVAVYFAFLFCLELFLRILSGVFSKPKNSEKH